ncbi:hypothetical protein PIROE2DRAFT_57952 [Piromyces sp. E2]|nr:hypothetical protein PIROE2DRAFT_57952 [Piromyces sp. E2]|eukprot:OUM68626.1 hypothetical protein PIROE2DRAFT_57952 [Piromyces sp. E2]
MRNRNKNVSFLNDKKHGVSKPPSHHQKPFPFQKPGFPIGFIKSTLGFSQKQDYKQRFHERNSNNNSRTIDVCDENINELKENIKKCGNPEKYIISKISNRKKNDVTESVIDALILVIERIWPDECTLDANSGTKNIFEETSLRLYITYILYQSKISLFIVYCSLIYLIKVGTEARKRIANGNLVQKKSRVISNLSELNEEEFENLRKSNVKLPSYLFRNYINEHQQLENQINGYNSSSSSNSNSNPMYESPTSILNNENSPNQEMMTINNAISKYHSYDSSMNQRKSLFSTISSFIPQFSGYEDSLYFKVPSNSLNYPKRMVNSLKNKYSDLENKMYSTMMTGLSKAYKLKEVASSSNPMNFLLNSSDNNTDANDKNDENNNNSDDDNSVHHTGSTNDNNTYNNEDDNDNENENDDDYDYDYETDTEDYYCNNIARKSLSAASSIKSLSSSLSSSIIDNISYLKQSLDGSDKRSKSKTQSNKSSAGPSYNNNNNNNSKQSYEQGTNTSDRNNSDRVRRVYSHNDAIDNHRRKDNYHYNKYNTSYNHHHHRENTDDNNNHNNIDTESTEALNRLDECFEFNNSSRLLPFSGRHAILACLILCSKFYYDNDVPMIKNKFWQTFCGLSNNSLNYTQSKILDLLDYNLVIEADRFSRFAGVMLTYTHLKNKVFFSQPYLTYNRRSIHLNILTTIALSESEQLQSSLLKTVNQFKKHVKDCQSYLNNNSNNNKNTLSNSNQQEDNNSNIDSEELRKSQKEMEHITDNFHFKDELNSDHYENRIDSYSTYTNNYQSSNENISVQDQNTESSYQSSNYNQNQNQHQNQNHYSKNDNSYLSSYAQQSDEYDGNVKSYNYMFKEPKSEIYRQDNHYDNSGYHHYSLENNSVAPEPPRRYSKNKGKEIDPNYLKDEEKHDYEYSKPYTRERDDKYTSNYNTQQYNYNNSDKPIPKKYNKTNTTFTSPVIRTQQLFLPSDSEIKTTHSYHTSSPSLYSTSTNTSSYSNKNNNSNTTYLNKKYSSNLLFKRVDDSYHMDLWKSLVHNYYYEPNSNGDSSAFDSQSGQHSGEQIIFSDRDRQVLDKENYKLIKTDRNNIHNNMHMLESSFTAIDNEYFKMKSSRVHYRSNDTSREESSGYTRHSTDISIHNICSHDDDDDDHTVAKIDRKDIENSKSYNYPSSQVSNNLSEDHYSDYPSSNTISYPTSSNNMSYNNYDKSESSKLSSSSYNRYDYLELKEVPNESHNTMYRTNSSNSYPKPIRVKREQDEYVKEEEYQYNQNNDSYYSHQHSNSHQSYELLNRNNKRGASSATSQSNSRVKMIKREFDNDYRSKPLANYSNRNDNNYVPYDNDRDISFTISSEQENDSHSHSHSHSHSQYSDSYDKYNVNIKKENRGIDGIHDQEKLKYNSYNGIPATDNRAQINHVKEENTDSSTVFPSIMLSPSESVKSGNSNGRDDGLLTPNDMDLPDVLNSPSQPKKNTPYRHRYKTSPFLTPYNNKNNTHDNSFEYNQPSSSMRTPNSYSTEIRNYDNPKNYSTIRISQPIFNNNNNNDKYLNISNYRFENNRKTPKSNNKMSISTIVDKL